MIAVARVVPASLLLLAACASAASAAAPPSFEEQVEVREVGVLVDFTGLPAAARAGGVAPGALLVTEAGSARTVSRVESVARAADVLVWIDGGLADGATRAAAALALADAAEDLAGYRSATVVVADPWPRVVVQHGDRAALAAALGEIARQAAAETTPAAGTPSAAVAALDRLVAALGTLPTQSPGLVLAPISAFAIPTDELERWTSPQETESERAFARAGETVGSYGWILEGVAIRRASEKSETLDREADVRVEPGPTGDRRVTFPVLSTKTRKSKLGDSASVERALDPTYLPWQTLLRGTGGTIVGSGTRLAAEIRDFGKRSIVWFRAPTGAPGELTPLVVTWAKDGRRLSSPRMVRSGTPDAVLAARARAAVDGWSPPAARSRLAELVDPGAAAWRIRRLTSAASVLRLARAWKSAEGEIESTVDPPLAAGPSGATRELAFPAGAVARRVVVTDAAGEQWQILPPPTAP
ncbi:MAG: hypothetical protein U0X73_01680 [Thermoanaerobaculia bacterium]